MEARAEMQLSRELRDKLIEFGYTVDQEILDELAAAESVAERSEAGRTAVAVGEAIRRIEAARASGSEPEPPSSPLMLGGWEVLGRLQDKLQNREIAERDLCRDARAAMHALGMPDCDEFVVWLRAHDPAEEAAVLLGVSVERIKAYWAIPESDRPDYRCRQECPETGHRRHGSQPRFRDGFCNNKACANHQTLTPFGNRCK